MKRFHVHVHVEDLAQSIAFYSKMFAAEPTRHEPDYAKWMLDDPRINFAISTRGGTLGVDHLGIQTDTADELVALKAQAKSADLALFDQGETSCCYAKSEKHWITDPQGVAWEHFHTLGDIPVFGSGSLSTPAVAPMAAPSESPACCSLSAPRGKPVGVPVKSSTSCC